MNARAWLLDFDGTLYHARYVRLAMAAELALLGWNAVAILRTFRKEHERIRHEFAASQGASPYALQIERTAQRMSVPASEVERLVHHWMVVRPGRYIRWFRRRALAREIAAFRAAGGRTAVVSDYPASIKLASLGWSALFDAVVANGEPGGPGQLKPIPEGYLLASQRLGVEPHECLVIGDRDDADGAAARAAGMQFRLIR